MGTISVDLYPVFRTEKQIHSKIYRSRPGVYKFVPLRETEHSSLLRKIGAFIFHAFKVCWLSSLPMVTSLCYTCCSCELLIVHRQKLVCILSHCAFEMSHSPLLERSCSSRDESPPGWSISTSCFKLWRLFPRRSLYPSCGLQFCVRPA